MGKGKRNRSRRRRRGDGLTLSEPFKIVDGIDVDCPECGQRVTIGYAQGCNIVPDGTPTAMHADPPCQTFIALDVDEFLKFVRQKLQGITDA